VALVSVILSLVTFYQYLSTRAWSIGQWLFLSYTVASLSYWRGRWFWATIWKVL